MPAKKHDQPRHDLVQQYLPGHILNMILGIIRELGDPYDAKPGLGGMTAYPPDAMRPQTETRRTCSSCTPGRRLRL